MDKQFIKRVIFIGLVITTILYLPKVMAAGSRILSIFTPLIVGCAMAFAMNVLMVIIEDKWLKKMKKSKGKRGVALLLTLTIIFIFMTTLILMVIPEIQDTFSKVAKEMPGYLEDVEAWMEETEVFGYHLSNLNLDLESITSKVGDLIAKSSDRLIKTTLGVTSGLVSVVINTLLGLVFAIYILLSKETLRRQVSALLKVSLKEKYYKAIMHLSHLSYEAFKNFITGQFLEALIIGVLCFIGMTIFRLPYAVVISALVGFTALIPVFGAFIGTIIGAFLIIMVSPMKALWFIIFIVVLQQLEGNLIYPKVVGSTVGLPGIWVLAAVTVGASAYGVLGMLIGVPLSSVIYGLLKTYVRKKEKLA